MPQQLGETFVLCVNLRFKSIEDRDEFIGIWRPLGEWVQANEPQTISFELLVADTDPLKIMVYERFVNKDAFTQIHQTSEPYLAFKAQQAEWRAAHGVEVAGQSYYTCSPAVGYHSRS